jgi:hypothetical protein
LETKLPNPSERSQLDRTRPGRIRVSIVGPEGPALELGHHLLQAPAPGRAAASRDRVEAAAQPPAGEIQHVVHQPGSSAIDAVVHQRQDVRALVAKRFAAQQASRAHDRGQGIAQIVAEHRDELLAELRGLLFLLQPRADLLPRALGLAWAARRLRS